MKTEIKELDVVALLEDVPSEHLTRGETGTVVLDFGDGVYLIEFSDNLGQTYAIVELHAEQLLVLHKTALAEIVV
jgi:hypothetical protein